MNATVFIENRFKRLPDGSAWTETIFPYEFWTRYLDVFDGVDIVSRAEEVKSLPPNAIRVDGKGVRLRPAPYYLGPEQYLLKYWAIKRMLASIKVDGGNAFIFRVPSPLASMFLPRLRNGDGMRPYGVEVVTDPYLALAPSALKHWLGPIIRFKTVSDLRNICRNAAAAAYVTSHALQSRYPAGKDAYSISCSDVILREEDFVRESEIMERPKGNMRLVTVATLSANYKGVDVLINALRLCHDNGFPFSLDIVGDGRLRPDFEELARRLGLGGHVRFLGYLPSGRPVLDELDKSALFVLPSRQEGLPRALIEAMARGLPCVATRVGGIPELLDDMVMVPPDAPQALADKIMHVFGNKDLMLVMSMMNLKKAREFEEDILRKTRNQFFGYLRDVTRGTSNRPVAVDGA